MKIMGIINLTPDSFYHNSRSKSIDEIQLKIEEYTSNNVDIIDIGAESSRPGSYQISKEEELDRLKPIFKLIKDYPKIKFSIDTYKSEVAEVCLSNGFTIVNDIYSGTKDKNILNIIYKYNAKFIMMHMKGTPLDMQKNIHYDNIIFEINEFFKQQLIKSYDIGINTNNIIIDPGIGFGKSLEDNYIIINNLNSFKIHDVPVLIGPSRKSFLSLDNDTADERLAASIVSSTIAFQKGADYIRVHDVKEIKKCIEINKNFSIYN